ncbi:sugar phosphate isomerase/epimerase family protein [Paenibacillus cymbidii]|uniref:sugar phosphate isomerase/epimerase family protein n=1 Tax=Paenibacillus cymbidii TaxID=1639034 RepID=UPI001F371DF8|nr:sugar phosphate isomerase/epimerase [Paenibacillus cymbidii]
MKHTIAGLNEVVQDLDETGVELCLENHHKSQFQFHDDYAEIMDALADTKIGITFDSGHFHSSKVDIAVFLQTFAARIRHVHLKDHIGTQAVSLGSGEIALPQIIRQLKNNNYREYISIELESNIHNNEAAGNQALLSPDYADIHVKDSYACLQNLIDQA